MSVLLIVTGASRGIGAALAVEFVKRLSSPPPSSLTATTTTSASYIRAILNARSMEGLTSTEESILELSTKQSLAKPSTAATIDITKHDIDLANLSTLEEEINALFRMEQKYSINHTNSYDRVIFINNAGNLGHLGPSTSTNLQELQQHIDFNVTSSLWFTARFLREMQTKQQEQDAKDDKEKITASTKWNNAVVVNVSSLCAVEPFPTMAAYCAGKAARNMYYRALAKEYENDTNVKFLNYAPGPCDTKMVAELSTCDTLDPGLQSFFRTSAEQGKLVQPQDTSKELVQLVLQNTFPSGTHIDYYDLVKSNDDNRKKKVNDDNNDEKEE